MQKRKFARRWAAEVSLPELVDRLELALTEVPPGARVFKALSIVATRAPHLGRIAATVSVNAANGPQTSESSIRSSVQHVACK
jgi:hypothetical protein